MRLIPGVSEKTGGFENDLLRVLIVCPTQASYHYQARSQDFVQEGANVEQAQHCKKNY